MNNKECAGFAIRLLARITDWLILFTPQALFLWRAGRSVSSVSGLTTVVILYITIFLILGFIISILYYSLATTYWGATPGKILAGLKVTDENGQNLSLGRSLFRHTIGYWVSGLLWGLGYLWIVRDPQKQGWHDQLTGSFVVKKKRGRLPLLWALLTLLLSVDAVSAASGVQQIVANERLQREVKLIRRSIEDAFKAVPEGSAPQKDGVEDRDQSETKVRTNVRIEVNQPEGDYQIVPPSENLSTEEFDRGSQRQREELEKNWEQQRQEFEELWRQQQEDFEKHQKESLEKFERKKQENQQWFEQQKQQMQLVF